MKSRARVFWIALPIALAFALWAGPGLADREAEMPLPPVEAREPQVADPVGVAADRARDGVECVEPHDPGPDGDR